MDAICKECGAIYTFEGSIPTGITCVCQSTKIKEMELPRLVVNE